MFLKKWLAPILRNLADTPERMAELDVNEGVVPLIELRFPPPGTLLTPVFPAPINARTFVILRLLGVLAGVLAKATGGRMPADQETIRYTGFHGVDADGEFYLMREVLGGGSGGRSWADGSDTIHVVPDSKNLPVEFTETRFPLLVERLGAGARLGRRRPAARRARLPQGDPDAAATATSCRWPIARSCRAGGCGAAGPARPSASRSTPAARASASWRGWSTTSRSRPGRWSASTPRAAAAGATRSSASRRSSPSTCCRGRSRERAAASDYGVVLVAGGTASGVDEAATAALRTGCGPSAGSLPFFDRGPGYRQLAGRDHAEVDGLSP